MRPWLLAPVVALLVVPASAAAQAQAPDDAVTPAPPAATATPAPSPGPVPSPSPSGSGSGGSEFGVKVAPIRPLHVRTFRVTPRAVVAGRPLTVRLRVVGSVARARMRVELLRSGARRASATLDLGWRTVGRRITRRWTPRGALPAGRYVARIHAVDTTGRTLKRTTAASGKQPLTVRTAAPAPVAAPAPSPVPAAAAPGALAGTSGVFPIRGPWSFGGPDARFGAQRNGHVHQGQDVLAAEGTPLVSPVAGVVYWRSVQPAGAGHYLVIRGTDGRDTVYMHLVAGSETVAKGDPVTPGEVIGAVGSTGDASGPHLHFELWPGGWYAKGSQPIDPLPQLQAWAAGG